MRISYLYVAFLSFFTGVFLATFFPLALPTITWLLCVGVMLLVVQRRFAAVNVSEVIIGVALSIIFFALGTLRLEIAEWQFSHSALKNQVGFDVTLTGLVATEPDRRERLTYLTVETEGERVLVSVDPFENIQYGDVVTVEGQLTLPDSFVTDLGRTFHYETYLKAKGILYQVPFAEVEVVRSGEGNFFIEKLLIFKNAFLQQIEQYLNEPAAGLGQGLLLGVKQGLGEELEAAFRQTGIIHIVVLSGYNIMLVVIFVMTILGYLLPKKLSIVCGIVAIVGFALMVGLSATVVRASIMASILLLTQMTSRRYLAVRGLLLAGFVMLLLNPYLLAYDVGFQLSFLATLGLIYVTPHFAVWCSWVTEKIGIRSFLVATLGTQLAVLPLLLYQIGELSIVSVLVNVLVLPMVPVAMLLTFMVGIAGFVSVSISTWLSYPAYFSLTYITQVAELFAQLPFASVVVPTFPAVVVFIAYALLAFLLYRFYKPELQANQSELGESLLTKNKPLSEKEDELSAWTIVEEFDAPLTKKAVTQRLTASKDDSDVPIFFR